MIELTRAETIFTQAECNFGKREPRANKYLTLSIRTEIR